MTETVGFGLLTLLIGAAALVIILANRLTERIKVPIPVLTLVLAAVAVKVVPGLPVLPDQMVEKLVSAALVCILFSGGMHMGWKKFRGSVRPITVVGIAGTFLTVAVAGTFIHLVFGLSWYLALLVGTAIAPTDPAVVFSVLGQREVEGRSGTVLEGESGANDPVGIALMAALLAAGGLTGSSVVQVGVTFVLQMGIGALVGIAGGLGLVWFMRKVPLPNEALYPLRVLAVVFMLYGVATLAHGSGFLAVFIAGILAGDARAPYKAETERFHAAIASLAEISVFVVLGLTVDLTELAKPEVWIPGLVIGAVLALVIRPLVVSLCLLGAGLERNERLFILFAGLKGAVPILLGVLIREAHVPGADRLYGIVVVVVIFSVAVQGSLTVSVARWLRLPIRTAEPEPWALGVRLRDEPEGVQRFVVEPDSIAAGRALRDLDELGEDAWLSFLVRDSRIVRISGGTELKSGDELLILAEADQIERLRGVFCAPSAGVAT